jgi:hypothetical protein
LKNGWTLWYIEVIESVDMVCFSVTVRISIKMLFFDMVFPVMAFDFVLVFVSNHRTRVA